MELTSELTITSRCPDRRTGTDTARTGTTHGLSGTSWTITGTTGVVGAEDILARFPKLRKDARANVENVLHELIADRNATIPQICACTGMALRTINNALATLRGAGILKARGSEGNADNEVAEKVAEKRGEVTEKVTETRGEVTEKDTEKQSEVTEIPNETDERIIALILSNPHITQRMLSEAIGLTRPYIGRKLLGLQARKIIRRVGPDRGGYWEVIKGCGDSI